MDRAAILQDRNRTIWVLRAFIQKNNVDCQDTPDKVGFHIMVSHGRLAVGWTDVFTNLLNSRSNLNFGDTAQDRAANEREVTKAIAAFHVSNGATRPSASSQASVLWRFIAECQAGDLVILAHSKLKLAGLFCVTGPVEPRLPSEVGLAHMTEMRLANEHGWKCPTRPAEFLGRVDRLFKSKWWSTKILYNPSTFFRDTNVDKCSKLRRKLTKALKETVDAGTPRKRPRHAEPQPAAASRSTASIGCARAVVDLCDEGDHGKSGGDGVGGLAAAGEPPVTPVQSGGEVHPGSGARTMRAVQQVPAAQPEVLSDLSQRHETVDGELEQLTRELERLKREREILTAGHPPSPKNELLLRDHAKVLEFANYSALVEKYFKELTIRQLLLFSEQEILEGVDVADRFLTKAFIKEVIAPAAQQAVALVG